MQQCQQNKNHALNKGGGKLRPEQWDVLCPMNQQSNAKDWDITLLVAVIRSELKLAPAGGWGNDQSKGAFVFLIRNLRNEVKHGSINDIHTSNIFNLYWCRIEAILKGIKYKNMTFFYNLKTEPLDKHSIAITDTVKQLEIDVDILRNSATDNSKEIRIIKTNVDLIKTSLKHLYAQKADKEDLKGNFFIADYEGICQLSFYFKLF